MQLEIIIMAYTLQRQTGWYRGWGGAALVV